MFLQDLLETSIRKTSPHSRPYNLMVDTIVPQQRTAPLATDMARVTQCSAYWHSCSMGDKFVGTAATHTALLVCTTAPSSVSCIFGLVRGASLCVTVPHAVRG